MRIGHNHPCASNYNTTSGRYLYLQQPLLQARLVISLTIRLETCCRRLPLSSDIDQMAREHVSNFVFESPIHMISHLCGLSAHY